MLSAFEEIYDEHVDRVYGYIAYRVARQQDAEDLTQMTFERALRAIDRFDRRRASHATWLIAIAKNLLIDHFRSSHERTPRSSIGDVDEALLPPASGPEPVLGVSPELAGALAELGDREREVIALRFGYELPAEEIAALMDLSAANVHQIVSRSLRRMRTHLDAERADAGQAQRAKPEEQRPARRAEPRTQD